MSGLSHHPGKVAQGYPCREFESRSLRQFLVPKRGLEPPHPKAHGPEPCASTNSAIWAILQDVKCKLSDFNPRNSLRK